MKPSSPSGPLITCLSVSSGIFLCLRSVSFIIPSSPAASSLLTNILSQKHPSFILLSTPQVTTQWPSSHLFIPSLGEEGVVHICQLHFLFNQTTEVRLCPHLPLKLVLDYKSYFNIKTNACSEVIIQLHFSAAFDSFFHTILLKTLPSFGFWKIAFITLLFFPFFCLLI